MKRIAFVLALVLLLLPVSVYATGSVEFTGKGFAFAPGSEYTTTDLFAPSPTPPVGNSCGFGCLLNPMTSRRMWNS